MMTWMLLPLRRYVEFGGRSRRREYWLFVLFCFVAFVAAAVVDYMLGYGTSSTSAGEGTYSASVSTSGPVELIVGLALFLPALAVSVRRLHDGDRRGWWVLLALVPLVGSIVLIVFYCLDGTKGPNRFGDDPKAGKAIGAGRDR